jgi:hypothetical protein
VIGPAGPDDGAVVDVDHDDLRGLGRAVDTGDEGHASILGVDGDPA